MAKQMKEGSETTFLLDKEKILAAIAKDGQYKTDEVRIRKWDGGEGTETCLIEAAKANIKFVGVLNKLFERDGYGVHEFANGDKYFGFFKNDQRNFNGIYYWPSEVKNGRLLSEMYYGFWKNNKKEKNGIYIWLDEPNDGDKNFDNTNLEAYVGRFEEGTYLKGTYLQKIEDDYHLYYGKFTKEGLKNDEGGFFYSSNLDRLFHGKVVNDVFVEGYITFFDSDEGKLESIVYANFDKDFNVTNIILEKDLQEDEKQEEGKLCSRFRDVILGIDYFGELYQKIKEITDFTENDMKNSEIFNDQEKFPSVIRLAVAYSKNNIDKDIYTKVFDH